jgi:hypothetical protein
MKIHLRIGNMKKEQQAAKALEFLREHPALGKGSFHYDGLFAGCYFQILNLSKEGELEKDPIYISDDSPFYEKFKDEVEAERKTLPENEKPLAYIMKSYEEVYGKPWEYDHTEYWWEVSFSIFKADPYTEDLEVLYDVRSWDRHQGVKGKSPTFEDFLIDCAEEIKRCFGDFGHWERDDFYLPEEIENRKLDSFLDDEESSEENPNAHIGSKLIFNDKIVQVSDALLNVRWLKWYLTTEHSRAWDFKRNELEMIVKKLDLMPEKRKNLLGL